MRSDKSPATEPTQHCALNKNTRRKEKRSFHGRETCTDRTVARSSVHTPAASVVAPLPQARSLYGCFCDGCEFSLGRGEGLLFCLFQPQREEGAPAPSFSGTSMCPTGVRRAVRNLVLLNQRLQGSLESASAVQWGESSSLRIQPLRERPPQPGFNGLHARSVTSSSMDSPTSSMAASSRYNRRLRDRLANRSNRFRHGDRLAHGASGLRLSSQRTSAGHRCTHVAQAKTWFFLHLLTHQPTKWATGGSAQRIGSCPECGRVHGTSTEGSRRLPGNGLHPLLTLFGSGVG